MPDLVPVPLRWLPARKPADLIAMARHGLDEARVTRRDGLRYAAAHLAAVRAAAALVAARSRPVRGRSDSRVGIWVLLLQVCPEMVDWAVFFASGSVTRAAVEAGIPSRVTAEEADQLLARADEFVTLVEQQIGAAR